VKMKGSGVEWLGEVPIHWNIAKLRWFLFLRSGDYISNTEFNIEADEEKIYPVIGGNGIAGFSAKYNIVKPTIAIGRVGALCGNVHVISQKAWITDNAIFLTNWREFDIKYLALLLQAMNLNHKASQNAQPLITGGLIKDQIAVIPLFSEQQTIVSYVSQETANIDALITKIREGIDKLKEYRTALISAAVTGKIDVRDYPSGE